MPPLLPTAPRFSWFQHVSKGVAVVASTAAALVSVVTALFSYGVIGNSESHKTIGNYGAAWVRLKPLVDTAAAIGDTVSFAATIADKNGSILVGAAPVWTTGDSTIAVVAPDGSVIARGPGLTTVSVVVGELVAHSRILVRQAVAGVAIMNPAGDTAAALLEGSQLQLHARALDSRGHTVPGRVAVWRIDDTTIATIDSRGAVTALNAGHGVVSANIEGASAYLPIAVITPAADLAVVGGANQRSLAGRLLPQRVVVRATTRKGAPAPGKLVTFRLRGANGKIDPLTVATDADGRARTQWTLGDDPGIQTLLASVENVDSVAVIDAEAEPVAKNTRITALTATVRARAGTPAGDSVGIRVTDSTGRALFGVPVRWTTIDGKVDVAEMRTDSAGVARARWTLSSKTGTQRLRAFVGAADSRIAPTTIAAAALAGAPATVVVVSGDRQRGAAGNALPKSIVLRVLDVAGNGAAGVPVALTVSAGTVDDSALVTDSLGFARTRWTMGHSSGDYALTARADSVKKPAKVMAFAASGRPANLSFDDAAPVKGSRAHAKRLVALVTDIYGNPVAESPVTFGVKSGTVTPTRAVTDTRGRVALTWMMGTIATEQTLKGSVRGTDVTGAYVAQVEHPPVKAEPKSKKP
jgi:hypothetical protein